MIKVGLYDTLYTIAADKDFLIRVALAGVAYAHLARMIYHYRQHRGSLTINRQTVPWFKIRDEHLQLAEHYLQVDRVFPDSKSLFKIWHKREAAEGVLQALREMKPQAVIKYGLRGHRYDAWWLLDFVAYLLHKIGSWVIRRRNG